MNYFSSRDVWYDEPASTAEKTARKQNVPEAIPIQYATDTTICAMFSVMCLIFLHPSANHLKNHIDYCDDECAVNREDALIISGAENVKNIKRYCIDDEVEKPSVKKN